VKRNVKLGLYLEALDTLFFRGGRALVASIPGVSTLPSPQTLAGAITTALLQSGGADLQKARGRLSRPDFFKAVGMEWLGEMKVRGPWLASCDGQAAVPFYNLPKDLRKLNGERGYTRLRPRLDVPGWHGQGKGMLPLWLEVANSEVEKDGAGYMSLHGLQRYLKGEVPRATEVEGSEKFYVLEERIGIGIDPEKRSSEEGKIYSIQSLRMLRGRGFYAELVVPEEQVQFIKRISTIHWGGERKMARLQWVEPVKVEQSEVKRMQAILFVTPSFFDGGWAPMGWQQGQCKAAAVAGPFTVSGWDLAMGQAKPTRFGVDAGSVYLFENENELPEALSEGVEDNLVGYGSYFRGEWTYGKFVYDR